MNSYVTILIWTLRIVAVLAFALDIWLLVDVPIGLNEETAEFNFSGPSEIWMAGPYLRSLNMPLLLLAAAEVLNYLRRDRR